MFKLTFRRFFCSSKSSEELEIYKETSRLSYNKFCDGVRIVVKGGCGGTGLPKLGGIGGNGGNVIIKGDKKLNSLIHLKKLREKKQLRAENGQDSAFYRIVGDPGKPLVINCPIGSVVLGENKNVIFEVNNNTDSIELPLGGKGGCRETGFLSKRGQQQALFIDLRLLSDVGFVGYPNAGKSTLLKAISRAKPKIASYPFTTIRPNIGIIEYEDGRKVSAADLPGLIEGSHKNIGLGHRFLKHIMRTRLLLFVISCDGFEMTNEWNKVSPIRILLTLLKEMELYDDILLKKPSLLAFSQMDKPNSNKYFEKFLEDLDKARNGKFDELELPGHLKPNQPIMQFQEIIPISSVKNTNIEKLRESLRTKIDQYFEEEMLEKNKFTSFMEIEKNKKKSSLTINLN